jgi:hypothetical protein
MSHSDIRDAIAKYANAYKRLQNLQDTMPWIPGGEQKTGSIGEYYAFVYLLSQYDESQLSFGSHTEKGWDIEVATSPARRIQVKTVSAFSKTRTISPIHRGWDDLYILFLSRQLKPEGFWIIQDNSIFGEKQKIENAKCRVPENLRTGSAIIPFGKNRVETLRLAIEATDAARNAPGDK